MNDSPEHWDSRAKPMPAATARVPYHRAFSARDIDQLQLGLIPRNAEDKWFGILRPDAIDFYRSRTGNHIYHLPLERDGDGRLSTTLVVNDDPQQYQRQGDKADVDLINLLLARMLGQIDVSSLDPNAPPAFLFAWVLVWALRGFAVLAAIWGLINIANALEQSRQARQIARELKGIVPGAEKLPQAANRASGQLVFTAIIYAGALVTVLLALAEGLKLCLVIEERSRTAAQGSSRATTSG